MYSTATGKKRSESTNRSSLAMAAEPKGLAMEPKKPAKGKKRNYSTIAMETSGVDEDMATMISSFGADISKSLDAKRKRLESFTESSIDTSNKKVQDAWVAQCDDRQHLGVEYQKQCSAVLTQWEEDLEKTKAEEEELQTLLKQKQKLLQQKRAKQTHHLNTLRRLHEQYMKGMEDLGMCHKDQQTLMMEDIKQEMTAFQKKILTETQHQDLSSVKRSLQTMLAQV